MSIGNTWKKLGGAYANRFEPESVHALARVYWRILLVTAALIILTVLSYAGFQFTSIMGEPSLDTTTVPTVATGNSILNRSQLDGVVKGFADKQARYQSLKLNPIQIADPSR